MTIRIFQIALAVILVTTVAEAKKHRKPQVNRFEKGVNAACDTTLAVLSDYKAQHRRNVEWRDVHLEVCRRLKVQRNEWFLGDKAP